MFQHRLSPSGLFLGNSPGFEDVGFLREVYFGAFPSADSILHDPPTLHTVETFSIALPLTWSGSEDPPETFDPSKLIYCIWANIVADTDTQGGTKGPSSMSLVVGVDAAGGAITPIQEVMNDVTGVFSDEATWTLRSGIHRMEDEAIDEIDIIDSCKPVLFRPGTIPSWTSAPAATAWVAGQTRHIYVQVGGIAETGVLVLPARSSRILIQEFYGTVSQHIGVAGHIEPQV